VICCGYVYVCMYVVTVKPGPGCDTPEEADEELFFVEEPIEEEIPEPEKKETEDTYRMGQLAFDTNIKTQRLSLMKALFILAACVVVILGRVFCFVLFFFNSK